MSGLPPGWNLSAVFRAGTGTRYTARPGANRIAARRAWDDFAKQGPIEWLQLLDGSWGCMRPGAKSIEERECLHYRRDY
jgi:hypothetical protein